MAKLIVVEEQRCLACRQCVLSCAVAHGEADSVIDAVVVGETLTPRVRIRAAGDTNVPVHCLHCDDAPCMAACKVDAITRLDPDGPVLITADLCIGCRLCVKACPYGAIEMIGQGKKGKAVKCDLCVDRTEAGLEPACVVACPTNAMSFCDLDDDARAAQRETAQAFAVEIARPESPNGSDQD